jgi:hypothetical protein
VPDGRWSIRNDPDALPIESEQMLEAAWHKMEKDAVVFTKKSLVCHFVFMYPLHTYTRTHTIPITLFVSWFPATLPLNAVLYRYNRRGHPPYQATSMLMDEKGVVRGAPRYVTRFSGQYNLENVPNLFNGLIFEHARFMFAQNRSRDERSVRI